MRESEESQEFKFLHGALFWFGVVLTVSGPIVFSWQLGDPETAWMAVVCGAFVTFVSKLHEIAELSLGPVKARMRETIQQAHATIDQLERLAQNLSHATLSGLMAGNFGFRDGLTLRSRLELHDQLISTLREIGLSEEQITAADDRWRAGMGVIYHRAIAPIIDGRSKPSQVSFDATDNQKAARKGWDELLDFDDWHVPSPERMRDYLDGCQALNDEISEWLDDYRHFLDTGEIRRRTLFVTK